MESRGSLSPFIFATGKRGGPKVWNCAGLGVTRGRSSGCHRVRAGADVGVVSVRPCPCRELAPRSWSWGCSRSN